MRFLMEWFKTFLSSCATYILKHADPQINSVHGVFNKFAAYVEANVLYGCNLARVQIFSFD